LKAFRATGGAVAGLLRTAWRQEPASPSPEALAPREPIVSLLLDTGCGALAWWRIHGTPGRALPEARPLQQAFRLHVLEAARRERDLEVVLRAFNGAGLEPILFKGWTLTRLYAHPALRPFGDFDLLVDEIDAPAARATIAGLTDALRPLVDLDMRVLERFLPDRSFAELAGRASTEYVGEARFRLLAPEDHLRLICLHQLDHGAWRPLWLCDVAAFVERLPPSFRWDLCLQGNPHLSEAVVALVSLAEELLGARLPPGAPTRPVPAWFRDAVLRGWAGGHQAPPESLHTLHRLGWRRALGAIYARWPDPVTATLHLRAPFRGVPRLVLQLAELGRRAFRFLRRTWRENGSKSLSTVVAGGQGVMP
jgi:hypothetical protein